MRLVSLAPSCTEVAFALGCGEWLVGRTVFCDCPEDAKRVPAVGGWTTANLSAVEVLKPDLVLTSTFLQNKIAAELRERGIAVCHTDPRTLADVLGSLETIAKALGILERGREIRTRVESELHPHAPITMPHAPRVYAEEWPDPPMASGNWVPDLIQLAGGQSFLPPGERSRAVTLDEVRAFDPDVVVLNYCGMENVPSAVQAARILRRPGWESLRAVTEGRIFVVPDSLLNRPGPRLTEGMRELARILAPVRADRTAALHRIPYRGAG